jgi:hypothetical protein
MPKLSFAVEAIQLNRCERDKKGSSSGHTTAARRNPMEFGSMPLKLIKLTSRKQRAIAEF